MNFPTEASRLAQECYDKAVSGRRSSRSIAQGLIANADPRLVEFLATEFLVSEVQRVQRAATLVAERSSEVSVTGQHAERPGPSAAQKQADDEAWMRADWLIQQSLNANIKRAIDRYAEEMKMTWTAELLDSTFALRDGTPVSWGDATIEDHEQRRQMFIDNAKANVEGASRHEAALLELRESGAATLREMVGATA